MSNYTTLLKTWGDTGSEYPTGYSYLVDEPPIDAWDNFFASNTISDIKHLIGLTNRRIESDKGTSTEYPTSPEESHIYHDQDNESINFWDSTKSKWTRLLAADGDKMEGVLDMGGYQIEDSTGSLQLAGDVTVSGEFTLNATDIRGVDDIHAGQGEVTSIWTDGTGSDTWKFYDAANSQTIAQFQEGGDVEIPNGQLILSDSSEAASRSWVNNSSSVPNADTVGGLLPGEVNHFTSEADISVSAGQFAIADDTGALYFEDGN